MNLQDIIKGELKNVEFKVELPKKSERYMKSVIAFANTSGGWIVMDSVSTEEEKKAVYKVTKEHLLNWKVLKASEGELVATNAFVLLANDYFRFSKADYEAGTKVWVAGTGIFGDWRYISSKSF